MTLQVMDQECLLTTQSELINTLFTGHQRADTMNFKDHNKANTTNLKLSTETDHEGQQSSVTGPKPMKMTDEPQEHKCHEEILSVQIHDMQKST